jgi:hypothetical protein
MPVSGISSFAAAFRVAGVLSKLASDLIHGVYRVLVSFGFCRQGGVRSSPRVIMIRTLRPGCPNHLKEAFLS